MLFTILPEHGIKKASIVVWDAVADKPLCEFIDGAFETDDETIIAKLNDLGYEGVNVSDDVPDPDPKVNEEKLLRDKAKALGIKSYHLKSVETLEKEIAELQGG